MLLKVKKSRIFIALNVDIYNIVGKFYLKFTIMKYYAIVKNSRNTKRLGRKEK